MFDRKPTLVVLITVLVVVSLFKIPLTAQQRSQEAKNTSAKLTSTLQEMLTTAKQLTDLLQLQYEVGAVGIQDVLAAQQQLLEVELKLASSPTDRAEALARQLKLAESAERTVAKLYENGIVAKSDLLRSRLARMHIEVLIFES